MSIDTDAMVRLAAGEDTALNELMHRWQERIVAFLMRMTGNQATACDLTQETFVKLYQSRARYRPSSSFSSYLFSIAANLSRNHHRWSKRHRTESLQALDPKEISIKSRDLQPDEALSQGEVAQTVQSAVQSLPTDLRETLVLFTYHELCYHEIATITGSSPKAVEMRLYRARQSLKESLQHLAPTTSLS